MNEPPEVARTSGLSVGPTEAGCKVLTFLERHCDAPVADFHRWIRTGQVRVNGGRTKPFARLADGDMVRVPPFAATKQGRQERQGRQKGQTPSVTAMQPFPCSAVPAVQIVASSPHAFVCVKPAGLPVHGGTGHSDSLLARLRAQMGEGPFPLTPAHRLDKATSGLVIVARSYNGLRVTHEAFAAREGISKLYLAWVQGLWVDARTCRLEDWLQKARDADGRERMHTVPAATPGALSASLDASCLRRMDTGGQPASLLELHLHTGRTHQIRVQLASRGFALIGDPKYGGPPCPLGMLLHAFRLELAPDVAAALGLEPCLEAPAPWPAPWTVL